MRGTGYILQVLNAPFVIMNQQKTRLKLMLLRIQRIPKQQHVQKLVKMFIQQQRQLQMLMVRKSVH